MPRNIPTTIWLHSFHTLARLCSESFKLGFRTVGTKNFQIYRLGLEEAEEPEIKLPAFVGSWRKQGNSRKNIFCFTDWTKAFVWLKANCGNFLKKREHQTSLLVSWEACVRVKKEAAGRNQTWNNWLVPNWERSMTRLYIVTLLM